MAARLESVAKYICEKSGWNISNLQLQKLMYLAQMIYMGRTGGKRLFEGDFEAWDYGPVEPNLYHKVKVFGSSSVQDIFRNALGFKDGDKRRKVMDDVSKRFLKFSAGDLVEITHWDEGAWAKSYIPNARNVPIPDEDILDEYRKRNAA
ncbi:Panacea domain-containing protein [Phaeobacter gallaeciensis]|uniref:Phage-associated protein n=1 Tax=Phaeobacter gallaeciensis TaxID=60890 RepID=A0AAC9Z608_9RHOB|nr:type II toxin-antitoxin system antitoxin SocA domain-containing protein [Phaeobacter gallaeciensis]AHD08088.1 putative phage-associated protein [Phaeobacter gallaeciensis DSM 26640]ATE91354.1 putative phage-associated protein [Phaeobacter gallaeciensis]ATE95630.1 putative phage-associated protein [Phaeobacter gallaeciensis]ATE99969.1 putative phage-associated protein [Phaeobacter gallaeciensis]ATF04402.1 putative phage-associated protein [Phaeobacter gallaeciensis]